MAKTRRERLREATYTEIKHIARRQMAEQGAAALSLNAIAREMGLTTPALYRYFANRDALVTELIVDAYGSLGDALETADSARPETDYAGRFRALCLAYRDWALQHPQDYTLIYGTPIPGYHAPRERTIPLAARVMEVFGFLLRAAWDAGQLVIPPAYTHLPPQLHRLAAAILAAYPDRPPGPVGLLALAVILWSQIHGIVWAELHTHFPPGLADSGELFAVEVEAMSQRLGLQNPVKGANKL
ncbi:MAG: TetR/AcrR family transcriptional regulator [Anaerolineae bacterium]